MKILVVHQYYLMPGQFGGSRFNEMSRLWSQSGHQVTVIAGTVDYASGTAPERYRGRWITEEQDGPVRVLRCYVPETYAKSFAGRMWGFFGFTLSASAAAFRVHDSDVVVATSPPLVAAIPGWLAARMTNRSSRLIFEIRDLWPESAITTGVLREGSLLVKLLYALERWACKTADGINVLTPAFQRDLVTRGLAADEKISFVPNGADLDMFQPGPRDNPARRELGWGDRFVALYAGAHGLANAVGQLISAAEYLQDRPDILIACAGDGPERRRLTEEAALRGLTNIVFHGPQAKERMPEIVNACDAGVAVLQDNPTFRTVYPNKVFDYMACAKPVVLAIDGVARELVCDEAQAGNFVHPESGREMADALRFLADSPADCARLGNNGRLWVIANAGREALADRYLDVMRRLVVA